MSPQLITWLVCLLKLLTGRKYLPCSCQGGCTRVHEPCHGGCTQVHGPCQGLCTTLWRGGGLHEPWQGGCTRIHGPCQGRWTPLPRGNAEYLTGVTLYANLTNMTPARAGVPPYGGWYTHPGRGYVPWYTRPVPGCTAPDRAGVSPYGGGYTNSGRGHPGTPALVGAVYPGTWPLPGLVYLPTERDTRTLAGALYPDTPTLAWVVYPGTWPLTRAGVPLRSGYTNPGGAVYSGTRTR